MRFGSTVSGTRLAGFESSSYSFPAELTLDKSLILPALQFLYPGKRITIPPPGSDVKVS